MAGETGGFKLLGEHVEGCRAAGEPHTFIVIDGRDFSRKRNGDRGGSTLWYRVVCNDTKCDAVALVRWDVLSDFINRGLRGDA